MGTFLYSASQRPARGRSEDPDIVGNTNPRKKHGNIPL